ncbi:5-hydroxytryptamine receptor 3A-like [Latimeria chalumnae]|uniref:5-hydroxytryptamine receptor 3A-like n=1 Tax=Latimeria chalumnae TaxID=7897 RepID=UPI00313E71D3
MTAVLKSEGFAVAKKVCSYAQLLNYLNITSNPEQLLYSRPVKNWKDPTVVTLRLVIYSILDVLLYSVGEDTAPKIPFLELYFDGHISLGKPHRIVSTCNLDVEKFPFDTQTCRLTIGPYLHRGSPGKVEEGVLKQEANQIRRREGKCGCIEVLIGESMLQLKNGNFWVWRSGIPQRYTQVVLGAKSFMSITAKSISTGKETLIVHFDALSIKSLLMMMAVLTMLMTVMEVATSLMIHIQRRPMLYIFNFILPSAFMLLLDILSFFIPEASGEKLGFKITVILGFSVLLLILNDILPTTSTIPLIAIFCIAILGVMLLSLLEIVLLMYLRQIKIIKPIPHILKKCMVIFQPSNSHCSIDDCEKNTHSVHDPLASFMQTLEVRNSKPIPGETDNSEWLKKAVKETIALRRNLEQQKKEKEVATEWQMMLASLENILFYSYLLLVLIFTVFIGVKWLT